MLMISLSLPPVSLLSSLLLSLDGTGFNFKINSQSVQSSNRSS